MTEISLASQTNCSECGDPIIVMAFIGTGVCCDDCRKRREAIRKKVTIDKVD